jgi:hypothetical protein
MSQNKPNGEGEKRVWPGNIGQFSFEEDSKLQETF